MKPEWYRDQALEQLDILACLIPRGHLMAVMGTVEFLAAIAEEILRLKHELVKAQNKRNKNMKQIQSVGVARECLINRGPAGDYHIETGGALVVADASGYLSVASPAEVAASLVSDPAVDLIRKIMTEGHQAGMFGDAIGWEISDPVLGALSLQIPPGWLAALKAIAGIA